MKNKKIIISICIALAAAIVLSVILLPKIRRSARINSPLTQAIINPKVVTKDGLRPEIENDIYTGDRNAPCKRDQTGKCIPAKGSYVYELVSVSDKKDKPLVEKLIIKKFAIDQKQLTERNVKRFMELHRLEETYSSCYALLSDEDVYDKIFWKRNNDMIENNPFEYYTAMEADHMYLKYDHNEVYFAVKKKYKSKEDCRGLNGNL